MERIDQIRAARTSPHVSFTDYLILRTKCSGAVLIFEGRQCPSIYMRWVTQLLRESHIGGQIIARGKRNLLALRDLIQKNTTTSADRNIYFVDRDYDIEPKQGTYRDVYVTRGYSIENEVIDWSVVEPYIRAYFDIADSNDQDSLTNIREIFHQVFSTYIAESREFQRVIYICRTKSLVCQPGESVFQFLSVDWENAVVERTYASLDALFDALDIQVNDRATVMQCLNVDDADFARLNPALDWRGKFHFSFIKKFLTVLREARISGRHPFKRPSKVDADPAHPSVMGALGGFSPAPQCLAVFLSSLVDLHN